MKSTSVLDDKQMKQMVGGVQSRSGCSAVCHYTVMTYDSNGNVISEEKKSRTISMSCNGTCTGTDDVGVTCSDGTKGPQCSDPITSGSGIL